MKHPHRKGALHPSTVAIDVLIDAALEASDADALLEALRRAAQPKGMSAVAREAQISRPHLYRALRAGGNLRLSALLRIFEVLGYRLSTTRVSDSNDPERDHAE